MYRLPRILNNRAVLILPAALLALSAALLAGSPPSASVRAQSAPCLPGSPPEECPFPFPTPAGQLPGGAGPGPAATICSSDGSQCVVVQLPGPGNPNPRTVATPTPSPSLVADLVVGTGAFQNVVTQGGIVRFSTSVFNSGPDTALGVRVTDFFPASLSVSWVCTASPGSACPASGLGAIDTTVDLAAGGSVAFTATVALIPGVIGQVTNTATVQPPADLTDSNIANNSASATITIVP